MKRALLVMGALALLAGISWAEPGWLVIRVNLKGPTDLPLKDEKPEGGGGGMAGGPGLPGGGPGLPGGGGGRSGGGGGRSGGGGGNRGGGAGSGMLTPNAPEEDQKNKKLVSGKEVEWFVVALPANITSVTKNKETKHTITHIWGVTPSLSPEAVMTDVYHCQFLKLDAVGARYAKFLAEKRKDEPLKVAEFLLAHWNIPGAPRAIDLDVRAKFEEFIDELNRDQARLSAADRAKVSALSSLKDALKKPLSPPTEDLARLKALPNVGNDYRALSKNHYTILHVPTQDKLAERMHARLEQILAGYYYWFALQGKPLPLPEKQLVVILAENENKFDALHELFDKVPLQTDGFYATFDNVMVVSSQRRDEPFKAFKAHVGDLEKQLKEQGLSFQKLVRGDPLTKKQTELKPDFLEYARAVALADRAAEEEGEISTLMYEAVQQLAAASGLLPRSVKVPQAIRAGLASFFSTPRSASELNLPALWTGIGGPHWIYLPIFRRLMDAEKDNDGKLRWEEKNTATTYTLEKFDLLQVISDYAYGTADKADKEDMLFRRTKAESEAWAVTYFLLHKKLDQLRKFYDELALLPRDMELPADVVQAAFGRAFDLMEPGKNVVAPSKLEALDREFREFMGFQVLPLETTPRK